MSIALRDRLVADGTVAGLVSTRIYAFQIEQDCTLPAISFQHIGDDPQNDLDGSTVVNNQHWEVDCWADSYSEASTLADAVEAAVLATGADFTAVRTDRGALFENQTGLYVITLDFSLWLTE